MASRRRTRSPRTTTATSRTGADARPTKADIDRQLRSWPPRRIASWSLMLLGGFVALQHLVAHAGFRPLPMSMGLQDLLLGYPAAVVLLILGAVLIDPRPRL